MTGQVFYRAKVPCRVGGAFRRAGEVFPLPEFETTPAYLDKVGGAPAASPAPPSTKGPAKAKKGNEPPGPMPGDLPGVVRD